MANQLYSYSSTYGAAETSTPSLYTEAQLKYSDILRYSSATTAPHLSSQQTWPPGVDPTDLLTAGIKRSSEALYHQTPLGTNATIQQSEAWYSTYYLGKRPRLESTSNLPVYPQRPGEKDCAHYMQTRTCKFGDTCKFDHPIWVPEGGIPDWKEVPLITTSESLPERPGEPDCPYFLKTQRCKFGSKCKFNHPKDKLISSGVLGSNDASALPERPSEPTCAFYLKTGNCKFGTTCKFHHPKDIYIPTAGQENGDSKQDDAAIKSQESGDVNSLKPLVVHAPAVAHNTKGLPIRLGEVDCPFYMKTGRSVHVYRAAEFIRRYEMKGDGRILINFNFCVSCKYGATCRYNHPDRNAVSYPAIVHPSITSPTPSFNFGVLNPAASLYHTIDSRLAQPMVGVGLTVYPQRPGHIECDFYMKTGECKFGERCKFHHPIDRTVPTLSAAKQATQENVKLTLAGLPRREGAVHCPYYMKTGTCKYGSTCKFDHPPPGEVIAKSAASDGGDEKEAYTARTQDEQE